MFQCQLPERGHFSLHTHCGLWDRNLCQCHAGYISQEPWTEWAKQTQTWLIPLVFHSIFRTQLVKNPDPEAVFRHYQIRKWISSQFRKKCSDALDEPSAEEAKWIRPNNETRQRTTAFKLTTTKHFFLRSQDNLCPDTVICLLHSLDQHITHSWLWLKQKPLILSGY